METSKKLSEDFSKTEEELLSFCPAILHLVKNTGGSRWQYVRGHSLAGIRDDLSFHRVDLGGGWAVQIYQWDLLDKEQRRFCLSALAVLEARGHVWTREGLAALLQNEETHEELLTKADLVQRYFCRDEIHFRGLIEFSNECVRDCAYCGLRRSNKVLTRYRMNPEEIFECAKNAALMGYPTVVLQSGEGALNTDELCGVVNRIKTETPLAVTLSVGECSREDYRRFKEAGADRYLLRFETSDPELFRSLRPGSTLGHRLQCLEWLKELGYQAGSGCMIGLPGQTYEMLADDLLLLQKLDLDMIGVGPFIPHPETPLRGAEKKEGLLRLVLRFVALVRLMTLNTHIPATTALGSIHPCGRQMALKGGADVIMPNVTPQQYRKHYEIYPNKICIAENPSDCGTCTTRMVRSLGRRVGAGPGHTLKGKR